MQRKKREEKQESKKKKRNIPVQNNYIYQSSIASIFVCFSLKALNIILVCPSHQSWLFSGHTVVVKGCEFCFLQNCFMYTFSSFGPCFCIDCHWAVSHFILLFATCHLIFTVTQNTVTRTELQVYYFGVYLCYIETWHQTAYFINNCQTCLLICVILCFKFLLLQPLSFCCCNLQVLASPFPVGQIKGRKEE